WAWWPAVVARLSRTLRPPHGHSPPPLRARPAVLVPLQGADPAARAAFLLQGGARSRSIFTLADKSSRNL
ncbi:hypothetical protein RZS08_45375, partial [Arthrospira platensis SPKY1]|nr:hypothetical protein [Arthrospira platensis SPKY1]